MCFVSIISLSNLIAFLSRQKFRCQNFRAPLCGCSVKAAARADAAVRVRTGVVQVESREPVARAIVPAAAADGRALAIRADVYIIPAIIAGVTW